MHINISITNEALTISFFPVDGNLFGANVLSDNISLLSLVLSCFSSSLSSLRLSTDFIIPVTPS